MVCDKEEAAEEEEEPGYRIKTRTPHKDVGKSIGKPVENHWENRT
jgi:hypothetical protein